MFVELFTYRHREHCGPFFDDDLGYRPVDQRSYWSERDPIVLCEAELTSRGWIEEHTIARLKKETQALVDEAFIKAKAAPYPSIPDLHSLVYRNPIR